MRQTLITMVDALQLNYAGLCQPLTLIFTAFLCLFTSIFRQLKADSHIAYRAHAVP